MRVLAIGATGKFAGLVVPLHGGPPPSTSEGGAP